MNIVLTTQQVFDAKQAALSLIWAAGRRGASKPLEPATAKFPGLALVGHLNYVHPNRVQVLGSAEIAYLARMDGPERARSVEALFGCETSAIVVIANDEVIPPDFAEAAERQSMPLFGSPQPSPRVIHELQYYLARALAERVVVHGVFMEVMSMGVLITGASGIGKSEIALELLSRGHRLVGDDAIEFSHVSGDVLEGRCPDVLHGFLEVRGLGILNVRAMFGETAIRREKVLHLILRLEDLSQTHRPSIDRLQAEQKTRPILGVEVAEVALYVAPGRNLAVLVETATRAHILRLRGINPLEDLIERQRQMMNPPFT